MNKKTIFAFLIVAALTYGALALISNRKDRDYTGISATQIVPSLERVHQVVLGDNGFEPEVVRIALGDTVEWSTTGKEFYWPASDLHPTHAIYPAFDAREPIGKDETWSFVFDQIGEWKYHDHLAPYFTGTVIVTKTPP